MSNKDYIQKLKRYVLEILKDEEVKIILFGSRAKKDNNAVGSDVDIGIIPQQGFDKTKLVFLRDKIEEMNIPYKIDIVDFSYVSEDFKKEALKEVEVWKD